MTDFLRNYQMAAVFSTEGLVLVNLGPVSIIISKRMVVASLIKNLFR